LAIVSQQSKQDCLASIFGQQKDLSFCGQEVVKNNSLTDVCRSLILLNQAATTGNKSLCQQIPLADYKNNCLVEYK